MKLVCGLGNPGDRYAGTRHNIGFFTVETFAQPLSPAWRERWESRTARVDYRGEDLLLVQPQTYMNLSGVAVGQVVGFFKIPLGDLLVVHDDVDLPLGRIQVRLGGGDGGHKGIRSIAEHLGSGDFGRVRVGVGRPLHPDQDVSDHVLGRFIEEENDRLNQAIELAVVGIGEWAIGGLTRAQNRVNRSKPHVDKPSCPERKDDSGPQVRKEDS
ncbi:MAG: aminoacyl-tRNA hydrolase [Deltaproteobacteria bacterium]|nr:aminoacyl-tRNA hydrolase [Deltaproteobacteria bacterium]